MKQPILVQIVVIASLSACGGAYTAADRSPFPQKALTTKFPFIIEPLDNHISPSSHASTKQVSSPPPKRANRYSLGIGKNLPVPTARIAMSSSSLPSPEDCPYEACRFLMEHQAVREYPSPSQNEDPAPNNDGLSATNIETRKASIPPERIRYSRRSEDALMILESRNDKQRSNSKNRARKSKQIIVAHTSKKLDMNTAWVEMLLHCEKEKLQKR